MNTRKYMPVGEIAAVLVLSCVLSVPDLRGIFVFKAESMEEANGSTNTDPAVQAGRLRIELYEWKLPAETFQAK
jgi:hypothetical protein